MFSIQRGGEDLFTLLDDTPFKQNNLQEERKEREVESTSQAEQEARQNSHSGRTILLTQLHRADDQGKDYSLP